MSDEDFDLSDEQQQQQQQQQQDVLVHAGDTIDALPSKQRYLPPQSSKATSAESQPRRGNRVKEFFTGMLLHVSVYVQCEVFATIRMVY